MFFGVGHRAATLGTAGALALSLGGASSAGEVPGHSDLLGTKEASALVKNACANPHEAARLGHLLMQDGTKRERQGQADGRSIAKAGEWFLAFADSAQQLLKVEDLSRRAFVRAQLREALAAIKDPKNIEAVRTAFANSPVQAAQAYLCTLADNLQAAQALDARNKVVAEQLLAQAPTTHNSLMPPGDSTPVVGAKIHSTNHLAFERLGVNGAQVLVDPKGASVSFQDALAFAAQQGGATTACFTESSLAVLREATPKDSQVLAETTVAPDGKIRCPFGFKPVAVIAADGAVNSEPGSPLTGRQCFNGETWISGFHGQTVSVVFEPRTDLSVPDEVVHLLKQLLPAHQVALPDYLSGLGAALQNIPSDELRARILLLTLRESLIYSLDPQLGLVSQSFGAGALQWFTDAGVGWCESLSVMVANLLNGINIPAIVIKGEAPSGDHYTTHPGHAMVLYLIGNRLQIFDPTIGATHVASLDFPPPLTDAENPRQHARSTREHALSKKEPRSESSVQSGHSCTDSLDALGKDAAAALATFNKRASRIGEAVSMKDVTTLRHALELGSYRAPLSYNAQHELRQAGLSPEEPFDYLRAAVELLQAKEVTPGEASELISRAALLLITARHAPHLVQQHEFAIVRQLKGVPPAELYDPCVFDGLFRALENACSCTHGSREGVHCARELAFKMLHETLAAQHTELSPKHWSDISNSLLVAIKHSAINMSKGRHLRNLHPLIGNPVSPPGAFERELGSKPALARAELHQLLASVQKLCQVFPEIKLPGDQLIAHMVTGAHEDLARSSLTLLASAAQGTIFAELITTKREVSSAVQALLDDRLATLAVNDAGTINELYSLMQCGVYRPGNGAAIQLVTRLAGDPADSHNWNLRVAGYATQSEPLLLAQHGLFTAHCRNLLRILDAAGPVQLDPALSATLPEQLADLEVRCAASAHTVFQKSLTDPSAKHTTLLFHLGLGIAHTLLADNAAAVREDPKLALWAAYPDLSESRRKESARQKELWSAVRTRYPEYAAAVERFFSSGRGAALIRNVATSSLDMVESGAMIILDDLVRLPSAGKFRESYGSTLAEMHRQISARIAAIGVSETAKELEAHAGPLPYKPEEILLALLTTSNSSPPPSSGAHQVINLPAMVGRVLRGTLKVPPLELSSKAQERCSRPRQSKLNHFGEGDPYDFMVREVAPGAPMSGTLDAAVSGRLDGTYERIPLPKTSPQRKHRSLTVVLHPSWLAEPGDPNSIEYPERLLSLVQALDHARLEGRKPRVLLYDDAGSRIFSAQTEQALMSSARELFRHAEEHADRVGNLAPQRRFIAPQADSFKRRPGEDLVFLCGSTPGDQMQESAWRQALGGVRS